MQVDDTNHGHALLRVTMHSPGKVCDLVDLQEGINICVQTVNRSLHQNLDSVLSQTLDKVGD